MPEVGEVYYHKEMSDYIYIRIKDNEGFAVMKAVGADILGIEKYFYGLCLKNSEIMASSRTSDSIVLLKPVNNGQIFERK